MPLTERQKQVIREQVPITATLPALIWPKYEDKIQRFLRQIDFIGCDDFEVTEEVELAIAAQACLLVANTDAWYYRLRTVLIYPGAYKSRVTEFDGTVMHEYEAVRLGESWPGGPVVLSWQHSEEGAMDTADGHNLVLHEFAHQIDDTSGQTDSVPLLRNGQSYKDWRTAFASAYERHVENVKKGRLTVLDEYGADDMVEFFAVAVEAFFEKPDQLKREEPEVYTQLSMLFALDPVSWTLQPGADP